MKKITGVLMSLLLVFSLVGCGSNSSDSSKTKIKEGMHMTLKENTTFCMTKSDLEEYLKYVSEKNENGKQKMRSNGDAIVFPQGTEFDVVDLSGGTLSAVEVDIKGDKYYTASYFLE